MRQLVAGMVFHENGKTLLETHIKGGLDHEQTIGGKAEPGEDPREAIIREFWEEYRLLVMPIEIMGSYKTSSARATEGDYIAKMYHCVIQDSSLHLPLKCTT